MSKRISINRISFFPLLATVVYITLGVITINNCYFWDAIQQVSKEANWYYLNNFSSFFMPLQGSGSELVATGYHPPLMGVVTALLWKIFGYKVAVSHVFVLCWAFILIYNLWELLSRFLSVQMLGWVLLIVLFDSTLMTQFSIASPDFILFTSFVIAVRAIIDKKPYLLAVGIFFLCTLNMRGVFAGVILFFAHVYFSKLQDDSSFKQIKFYLPYLPTFVILGVYYTLLFINRGWFISDTTSPDGGHYAIPQNIERIIHHIIAFCIRNFENGRIVLWILGAVFLNMILRRKEIIPAKIKFILLIFSILMGIYILFIFITQMPFSTRYFLLHYFILTLFILWCTERYLKKTHQVLIVILILSAQLTGNFWIYPDPIAKSWDSTLAHLPYYELRNDCFEYLKNENINLADVSSGFCLAGNQQYIDLKSGNKRIGYEPTKKYFIYSNISNVDDKLYFELQNEKQWKVNKTFERGAVKFIVYQKLIPTLLK